MKDVVIGRGQIGYPIMEWLHGHNIYAESIDLDKKKTTYKTGEIDCLHVCFPFSGKFRKEIAEYLMVLSPRFVIIHSTVQPGTTEAIQKGNPESIVYSPVRGVHGRMLNDLKTYSKWYACEHDFEDSEFRIRFPKNKRVDSTKALERTKILCDTTYLGWLIAYRKMVDQTGRVFWDYAQEIDDIAGNRPVFYNDEKGIGGHCIIDNLSLIDDEYLRKVMLRAIGTYKK